MENPKFLPPTWYWYYCTKIRDATRKKIAVAIFPGERRGQKEEEVGSKSADVLRILEEKELQPTFKIRNSFFSWHVSHARCKKNVF